MMRFFYLLLLFAAGPNLLGQPSYDYGLFLGTSQEHLHTILPVQLAGPIGFSAGGYYRYNLNSRYAIRAGVNLPIPPNANVLNGLDAHGLFELNFLPLDPRKEKMQISTFVATGLGIYVPENGGIPVSIPFNLGAKFQITPQLGMTAEWALRKTFENNLELDITDHSPLPAFLRSNWRSYFGVTLGYRVLKECKTCPFYEKEKRKRK